MILWKTWFVRVWPPTMRQTQKIFRGMSLSRNEHFIPCEDSANFHTAQIHVCLNSFGDVSELTESKISATMSKTSHTPRVSVPSTPPVIRFGSIIPADATLRVVQHGYHDRRVI